MLNIVGNAVKFTDKGFIRISVYPQFSTFNSNALNLIIEVEDTGIGIPEEQHDHIFDTFTQTESQNTKHFEGSGLGLAISKRLLDIIK